MCGAQLYFGVKASKQSAKQTENAKREFASRGKRQRSRHLFFCCCGNDKMEKLSSGSVRMRQICGYTAENKDILGRQNRKEYSIE